MKQFLSALFVAIVLLFAYQNAEAVQAYPDPIEYKLPDGSLLTIMLKGDEKVKWATTTDGYTILRNKKGFFEYATQSKEGNLSLSGIRVSNVEKRTEKEKQLLQSLPKGLKYSQSQTQMMKSIWDIKQQEAQKSFPTTGERKLICILMGFQDLAFTKTKEEFDALFNQVGYNANGATGSVKDYYLENSWGQFDLTVTVAGPYTASNNMAYYGGNNSNDNDSNPRALATEAVLLADADVNFKEIDNDNNGYVDGIYIIFAGYGEEAGASEDAIWSHAWSFSEVTVDGVKASRYSCSPELKGNVGSNLTSIGVICHEFGHVLGAPDYYDTDYEGSGGEFTGTGKWDMMAGGSWNNGGVTPAHHNGFTKTYFYNWAPITTLKDPNTYSIYKSVNSPNSFYQINTETTGEFFLLEYRNKEKFDSYIPGSGLIIYHVHKDVMIAAQSNSINTMHPQKMYPVCASASKNPSSDPSSYGLINTEGTPFPGASNTTLFTAQTTPTMLAWNGIPVDGAITKINENKEEGYISFDFKGGLNLDPTLFEVVDSSSNQISLAWKRFNEKDVILAFSTNPITSTLTNGTNYSVGETLEDGSIVVYKGSLESFTHTDLAHSSSYHYKLWSILSPELDYSNGVPIKASTACLDVTTLPFMEDFENSFLESCWTHEYISKSLSWQWGIGNNGSNPAQSHSGVKNVFFKASNRTMIGSTSRIILPSFDLREYTSNNIELEFWMTNEAWSTDQDVLSVYYKTLDKDWILLQTFNTSISQWTKQTVRIPQKVQGLQIAFEATANYGRGVCIDDIKLYEGSPVSTPTNELENARIYPNPFSNEINIENLVAAKKVKVVNLLGQTLIEQQVSNETSTKINTENLAAGIYLIVIEGNNGLRAVSKLVKR
ncbi:MAG: M6 family metalloprotease domain-containing protein [Tenuifilaceae bacterium]|jgi:M6 family metalloprotease-like protein|nr:M6 family metalloprotease domain-containing protein [Tenuifilaceae bacterium]